VSIAGRGHTSAPCQKPAPPAHRAGLEPGRLCGSRWHSPHLCQRHRTRCPQPHNHRARKARVSLGSQRRFTVGLGTAVFTHGGKRRLGGNRIARSRRPRGVAGSHDAISRSAPRSRCFRSTSCRVLAHRVRGRAQGSRSLRVAERSAALFFGCYCPAIR